MLAIIAHIPIAPLLELHTAWLPPLELQLRASFPRWSCTPRGYVNGVARKLSKILFLVSLFRSSVHLDALF